MGAEEVAVEAGAGPPPVFGHEDPVPGKAFAMRFGTETPGIQPVNEVYGGFASDSDLDAEVGGSGGVVKKVCLDGNLPEGRYRRGCRDRETYQKSHHSIRLLKRVLQV